LSGAFSSSAFDTNAFSVLAWDFGTTPPPVVVRGGHFGKKHKEREFSAELQAKRRLHDQIVQAFDGPHAEAAEEALEAYLAPVAPETRYLPPVERIQWDKIYRQLDQVEMALLVHIAAAEDDDDEDVLLLNG